MFFHLIAQSISYVIQHIKRRQQQKKLPQQILAAQNLCKQILKPTNNQRVGTLLIKCDDIGDYLLWKHTAPYYQKYAERPIIFVGNKVCQSLYESENPFADEVIWIDKKQWQEEAYKKNILLNIASKQVQYAISMLFTRNILLDDILLQASGAQLTYAWSIQHHIYYSTFSFADTYVKYPLSSTNQYQLEYFRNIELVEKIYHQQIPHVITQTNKSTIRPYLVVVPVASVQSKSWSPKKIAEVIQSVYTLFNQVILLGGNDAIQAGEIIIQQIPHLTIQNKIGKTTLYEMQHIIAGAQHVLCPDTAALHMAVLQGVNVTAVTNGTMWQRFTNYAPYISSYCKIITPPLFKPQASVLKTTYTRKEIQRIEVQKVIESIQQAMQLVALT